MPVASAIYGISALRHRVKIMSSNHYTVLLNDSLKNYLLSLNAKEKQRIREKFEFLENGIWDSGVRVKKLKSVPGKLIFEARVSKGDRIIFTLGRQDDVTLVYVWGIFKHDDVNKKARSILPENAGFLRFEEESAEETGELSMDGLSCDYFTQEPIEEKAKGDYGPQKWLVLTNEEWNRILRKPDPDNFDIHLYLTAEQAGILGSDPPMLLSGTAGSGKTTIAVYYLLRNEFRGKRRLFLTASPFLRDFSKRIYDSLVAKTEIENETDPPSFLTFTELLADIHSSASKPFQKDRIAGLAEFEDVFRSHKSCSQYDSELVWEEIRSIIKGAKSPVSVKRFRVLAEGFSSRSLSARSFNELADSLADLANYAFIKKVENVIAKKTDYSSYDDFLARLADSYAAQDRGTLFLFSAMLDIIDNHVNDFTAPYLTLPEYLMLGRKRAPHFVYDREGIYSIAEYYQSKLEEKGVCDEIDLTRNCIRLLENDSERFSYDLVVCDEAQDFCDVQVSLVLRLCRTGRNVVFAGDPKQIVNPSGFRWEEVRKKFYERGASVPEVKSLSLNFRCVGNIVRLANAILDLKQKLVGVSGFELREDWKFNGKTPLVVFGLDEDVLANEVSTGASGRIVITRTKKERDALKKRLSTELVFTINDAKGLEFDTVLLWNFTGEKKSKDTWRRLAKGDYLDEAQYPHVKHELNLLYVAITRARNTLVIYDGADYSDIWKMEQLKAHVHMAKDKSFLLEVLAYVSTPAEWERQGDYFSDRGYHKAAYECYKNCGNVEKIEGTYAFVLESEGEYARAAELFERHGIPARAAECYERVARYDSAMALWKKAGDPARAKRCSALLLETRGNFGQAGDEWEKLKDLERACMNWEKAGNYAKIGSCQRKSKQYDKASLSFEKAKMFADSASCAVKARKYERAADLYFKAGDFVEASVYYRKLKDRDRLMNCLVKMERYYDAGIIEEKNGNYEKAIHYYGLHARRSEEDKKALKHEGMQLIKNNKPLSAGLRLSAVGDHREAGTLFMEKGLYPLAEAELKAISDHALLSECYELQDKYYESAIEIMKSGIVAKWLRAEELFRQFVIGSHSGNKFDKQNARLVFDEARKLEKSGNHREALVMYKAINYPDGVYSTCLALKADDEAIAYFFEISKLDYATRFVSERRNPSLSKKTIMLAVNYLEYYSNSKSAEERETIPAVCRFIEACVGTSKDAQLESIIRECLNRTGLKILDTDFVPIELMSLLVRLRCFTRLAYVVLSIKRSSGRGYREFSDFLESLKSIGMDENNPNLLTCYYFHKDPDKFEEIMATLPLTEENYALFGISKTQYGKLLDFITEKSKFEIAADLAAINENYEAAAVFYTRAKKYKEAVRLFAKTGQLQKAIECLEAVGAHAEVAKLYEKMKEYDKALAIWKKLERMRDIKRVEGKIYEKKFETKQPELF